MSASAAGSPASELAGLLGTEIEYPVLTRDGGQPPTPGRLAQLWPDLARRGWTAGPFGVTRPCAVPGVTLTAHQTISTDTGPVLEIATAPAVTLDEVAEQVATLEAQSRAALERIDCALLHAGVHPALTADRDSYLRFRTPRPAYDYAIEQRGWRHWTIVDKAAVQEIVDVPVHDAPRAVGALHRLAGLMNVLLRNDPDLHEARTGLLSVRPLAWREHVPHHGRFGGDVNRVLIPRREVTDWQTYLSLSWVDSPMFLVGTKDRGLAYVPEHPAFVEFLRRAAADGWDARLLDGTPVRVRPDITHVVATDWTYMGYARIRWKWRDDPPTVDDVVAAWDAGTIDSLLERSLQKVVIENRSTAAQPEGEALVSLALVAGLIANLDATVAFTKTEPYEFWLELLDASTRVSMRSSVHGRDLVPMLEGMLDLAEEGLRRRGEAAPESWLAPLRNRIAEGRSPAEVWLARLNQT